VKTKNKNRKKVIIKEEKMSLPVTMPDISKFYREERDYRNAQHVQQKAAYRQALEKQMKDGAEKREREEEYRKKYEIQMLQNYPPFGRRTDFSVNYETVSNASNNVASMKDFDGQIGFSNNEKVPKRYSSFEDNKKQSPNEPTRANNESRLSRDDNRFSTFGTTTGQDPYYPFGKPGNGAPILDSTGHKQTRIAGNLWFHINGKTPEEINEVRKERINEIQTRNPLKSVTKPEPSTTSTTASMNDDKWIIERKKAFLDQLDTMNTDKYKQDYRLKKPADEYASLRSNANWFNNTFGRPGNGAPLHDPKRHNLEEVLESPRGFGGGSGNEVFQPKKLAEMNTNVLYPKVKPTVSSSHRNHFDYVPQGGKNNIFNM
jgi:hypothetical protein